MEIKRGQIWYADLSPVLGSEQGGLRPVLIIQNDVGNRYSPTVIVAIITSQIHKKHMPTQVLVGADCGLALDSMVMCEQIRTIDKRRLKSVIGAIDELKQNAVDRAIKISLGG